MFNNKLMQGYGKNKDYDKREYLSSSSSSPKEGGTDHAALNRNKERRKSNEKNS